MHVETRSFMISLSTFCFMLALAGYPPHVFQPNIYHLISHPADVLIPQLDLMQSQPMRRPVTYVAPIQSP